MGDVTIREPQSMEDLQTLTTALAAHLNDLRKRLDAATQPTSDRAQKAVDAAGGPGFKDSRSYQGRGVYHRGESAISGALDALKEAVEAMPVIYSEFKAAGCDPEMRF